MSLHESNIVDAGTRTIAGHTVGALAFGCWRLTGTRAHAQGLVETALDCGSNLIDAADVYGFDWGGAGFGACEQLLGEILRDVPSLRDRMVLATKGGIWPGVPYNSSHAYLSAACEASLRRLGTDHVELYMVHRPDPFTHPHALAGTLQSLIDRGLVGAVGVSNYSVSQTAALSDALQSSLVVTQPEFSALCLRPMRDGVFDQAMTAGIVPLAWSPLAGGRLASGVDVPSELISVLDALALREDVDRAAICLAFVLAHPSRPVAILGTQDVDRLRGSWHAATVSLSRADVYSVIEASDGVTLP